MDHLFPFTSSLGFGFDILLYTLTVIGAIAIYKRFKAKEKLAFLLIPTTLVFISFILSIFFIPFS